MKKFKECIMNFMGTQRPSKVFLNNDFERKGESEMNLNRVAIRCTSNEKHQMFKETDGARCVECKSIMQPIPVSAAEYYVLPSYSEWHKKHTQKPKQSISITVDADTDKLQLKLRTIAKHAEALAKELDIIDSEWLCDCGSYNYHDLCSDSRIIERVCDECKERYAMPNDEDLPTRLESSE